MMNLLSTRHILCGIILKMKKENNLEKWKGEIINVLLAIIISIVAYISFNHFKISILEISIPIIFLLILILLRQKEN